ncbi:TIGR02444 family protein [Oricola sp.]|uniref:TIGR02444 family protein n=1 Tax=Oricola sp. TaxID=1979950 RepID=UPI0025FFADDA|nr:TIGR02444 family protein [Oricola sp.]MCI5074512.1 TIGR02444 family protein [Oricola sp.]
MAEALWPFSLRFYDDAGTQKACLALQDQFGGDVNLMLWLLWRASKGEVIDASGVRQLDDLVKPWRNEVVQPLRALRRHMKERDLGPGREAQDGVRERIKAVELSAEKAQQAMLDAAEILPEAAASPADAAALNLQAYGGHLGAEFSDGVTRVLLARFSAIS